MPNKNNILYSNDKPFESPIKIVGAYLWDKLNKLSDDLVCLIDARTDERLTIGELKTRANNVSMALIGQGVTKGDRIAFSGQNSIQHAILRFSAKLLGLTFMPLSPTFESYEVQQEVQSAGTNIIVTSSEDYRKFQRVFDDNTSNRNPVVKLVVVFDGELQSRQQQHQDIKHIIYGQLLVEGSSGQQLPQIPYYEVNTDTDPLFLIHTSGSTGRPKCAMIPHRTFIGAAQETTFFLSLHNNNNNDNNNNNTAAKNKQTVCAMPYPCGHISGTCMIPLQLISGAQLVIMGEFDEDLLFRSIEKYRIQILPAFPSFGRRLIEGDSAQLYDLSSLQLMSTGGAAFPGHIAQQIIDKYGIKFKEAYGMTEFLWVSTGSKINDKFESGNVGQVAPGCELKICDLSTGQPLCPNQDGEICIRGNKLFMGYLDSDDRINREAIDEDGWYRTGDIGHYDQRERLFITDRLKEVVRIGIDNHYINMSPVEIEMFVLTHPAVSEVAVVGVNNSAGTHWPRAYVVRKPGHTVTGDDIVKFVADMLAYTKQLKAGVVFVDTINRTSIGKVDRKYYRNLVKNEIFDYK
ncbi:uncharacterized protein LOC128951863 [Oppia nitens]|uniref:uncharacterized protein LOC128951863 n=1 Tax=Oppia nitens TaxID=1686743 RepID=UPI0023DB3869|nr:uncharacterized protein LOC128951863 [Oppia nitens]